MVSRAQSGRPPAAFAKPITSFSNCNLEQGQRAFGFIIILQFKTTIFTMPQQANSELYFFKNMAKSMPKIHKEWAKGEYITSGHENSYNDSRH